jgi:hypothetical protein
LAGKARGKVRLLCVNLLETREPRTDGCAAFWAVRGIESVAAWRVCGILEGAWHTGRTLQDATHPNAHDGEREQARLCAQERYRTCGEALLPPVDRRARFFS